MTTWNLHQFLFDYHGNKWICQIHLSQWIGVKKSCSKICTPYTTSILQNKQLSYGIKSSKIENLWIKKSLRHHNSWDLFVRSGIVPRVPRSMHQTLLIILLSSNVQSLLYSTTKAWTHAHTRFFSNCSHPYEKETLSHGHFWIPINTQNTQCNLSVIPRLIIQRSNIRTHRESAEKYCHVDANFVFTGEQINVLAERGTDGSWNPDGAVSTSPSRPCNDTQMIQNCKACMHPVSQLCK